MVEPDKRLQELWTSLEKELTCSICLNHLSGSVGLPCGHAFCNGCITEALTKLGHSCPICKQKLAQKGKRSFSSRPILDRLAALCADLDVRTPEPAKKPKQLTTPEAIAKPEA